MSLGTDDSFLFRSKFRRPLLAGNYVARPRLINKLNTFHQCPLILVSAPAGYGKTTLLSAWAEQVDLPVVWLSLNDDNNDLQIFLSYLIGAVRTTYPGAFPDADTLTATTLSPTFETIIKRFVNELDRMSYEFILILDNYEFIYDRRIHELIEFILRNPIPQLHLLLSTRYQPPFPIAGLRARNLLGEIHNEDLRFTWEEMKALFDFLPADYRDEATIEHIFRKMEGWAAGLTLSAAALSQMSDGEKEIPNPTSGSRYIADYLACEVLSRITGPCRDLLYKAAIPDKLCAGLCDSLFRDSVDTVPATSGYSFLRRLEQENLFISAEDNESGWYRFHPVFREVLHAQLEEYYRREEIEHLYEIAANWLALHGFIQDALSHARMLHTRAALELFTLNRQALMELGTWQDLEGWLALFTGALIESQPDLLLSKAWLMLAHLRLPETAFLLDRIETLLSGNGNWSDPERWTELRTLRAMYYLRIGDARQALDYVNLPTNRISEVASFMTAAAVDVRVGAYQLTGEIAKCAGLLLEHMPFTGAIANYQLSLRLLPSMCTLNMIAARLADAERTANLMLTISREQGKRKYIGIANLNLGAVAYHKNELQPAEEYFMAAVDLAQFMDADKVITSYLGFAATEQALGKKDRVRTAIESAKSYLISIHSLDLLPYVEVFEAELMLRHGKHIHNGLASLADQVFLFTDILYHPGLTACRQLISSENLEDRQKAISRLEQLHEHARSTGNDFLRIATLAQSALALDADGNPEEAREHLYTAISLAEPGGFIRIFLDLGTPMASLLQRSKLPQTGLVAEIMESFAREVPTSPDLASKMLIEHLTEQELRVLGFLRQRLSNKEIADELSIAAATVKSHTIHIYQKFNVDSRRGAVEKAFRLGIFSP